MTGLLKQVDSRSPIRGVNKIFGLGLWRTGTTSLTKALKALGIRCRHYPYDRRTQAELWSEAKPLTILTRYDAITDISIVPFYKTLDRLYPGSRFILTLRDEAAWLDSMRRQMEKLWNSELMQNPQFREFTEAISERVYGGIAFEPRRLVTKYREHAADVERYFAQRPGDLLKMNIPAGDGWERLCPFLDVPIPDEPFPRTNAYREPGNWDQKVRLFLKTLTSLDSDAEKVILVDDGKLRAYVPHGEKPVPFPSRNGRYLGRPRSGEDACNLLLEAVEVGIDTLVLAWPAFWWLETYPEFVNAVHDRFAAVEENEVVMVYRRRNDDDGDGRRRQQP